MENNQRYRSNLLRCQTSREQRIIRTFESNAFLTLKPAIRSDVRAVLGKEV